MMNARLVTKPLIKMNDADKKDADRKRTVTVQLPKPVCESGVCLISWKPIRPAA